MRHDTIGGTSKNRETKEGSYSRKKEKRKANKGTSRVMERNDWISTSSKHPEKQKVHRVHVRDVEENIPRGI
jgi:hypothetical protein